MIRPTTLTVALTCVWSAATAGPPPPDEPPLTLLAMRLGVTDLAKSVDFYTTHLGFVVDENHAEDGYVVLMNHEAELVLTPCEEPVSIAGDAAHVRFNFKTRDLDAGVERLKAAGVPIVGTASSAVGRYVTFTDPSGHRHNLKQLFKDDETYDAPRVYDVGIAVTDMPAAEAFYAGALGFEVMSRRFYPPVIPFNQRGCTFFILSEGAAAPAPYDYGRTAHAGLAFRTADIEASITRLKHAEVNVLHDEPRQAGPVLYAAFKDPFGNIHELVQHMNPGDAPGAAEAPADERKKP